MIHPVLFPVGLLGWAAAGVALGAGWKLGGYLADLILDKEKREKVVSYFEEQSHQEQPPQPPLWKRKFHPVSEE